MSCSNSLCSVKYFPNGNRFINPTIKQYFKKVADNSKLLKINPNKTIMILNCFACHGMMIDGRQVILINEYLKAKGFYKSVAAEKDIRDAASKYYNAYYLAIFACCRAIQCASKHSGCFSKEHVL